MLLVCAAMGRLSEAVSKLATQKSYNLVHSCSPLPTVRCTVLGKAHTRLRPCTPGGAGAELQAPCTPLKQQFLCQMAHFGARAQRHLPQRWGEEHDEAHKHSQGSVRNHHAEIMEHCMACMAVVHHTFFPLLQSKGMQAKLGVCMAQHWSGCSFPPSKPTHFTARDQAFWGACGLSHHSFGECLAWFVDACLPG